MIGPTRPSPTHSSLTVDASKRPKATAAVVRWRRSRPTLAKWRCKVRASGDQPWVSAMIRAIWAPVRSGFSRRSEQARSKIAAGVRGLVERGSGLERLEPPGPPRPDPSVDAVATHPDRHPIRLPGCSASAKRTHHPPPLRVAQRRVRRLADQGVTEQRDLCRPVGHGSLLLAPVPNGQDPKQGRLNSRRRPEVNSCCQQPPAAHRCRPRPRRARTEPQRRRPSGHPDRFQRVRHQRPGRIDRPCNGSRRYAQAVKCALTRSAADLNRRSHPRTVPAGTPISAAIRPMTLPRSPWPPAPSRSPPPGPGVGPGTNQASNTCVTRHDPHRPRRGRIAASRPSPRNTRAWA